MELIPSLILAIASLFAGFFGGQVGGGGMVTLPVLLLVGLNPLIAMGTNRFAAIFLNLSATFGFHQRKKLSTRDYILFGIIGLIGSFIGIYIVYQLSVDELLLKKFIVAVLFCLVIILFFKQNLGLADRELKLSKKHWISLSLLVLAVAIYGGILAVAMTTFLMMVFTMYKQSFLQGMSYALYISFIVCLSSAIVFMIDGAVHYPYAILQAVCGGVGSYFGAKFALKKGNLWIKNLALITVVILLVKLFFEIRW